MQVYATDKPKTFASTSEAHTYFNNKFRSSKINFYLNTFDISDTFDFTNPYLTLDTFEVGGVEYLAHIIRRF